jgi:hypothetical protein
LNHFQIDMAFKNEKNDVILTKVVFTSKFTILIVNFSFMDYMVTLHFIDLISWGVLDNGPLYTL